MITPDVLERNLLPVGSWEVAFEFIIRQDILLGLHYSLQNLLLMLSKTSNSLERLGRG